MSVFEIMALDEANQKITAPLASDTYIANRAVHFTANITTDSLIDGRDVAADGALAVSAAQPGDNLSIFTNDIGFTGAMTGAQIKAAYQVEPNAFTDAQFTKLSAIETAATADQTNAEIQTAYQSIVPLVSQAVAEAGTATTIESWSALRVKQAIVALSGAPEGTGVLSTGVSAGWVMIASGSNTTTWANPSCYGILSCQGGTTGEATVDATPRKVAAWNTNGVNDGVTPDATNDHLKILTDGTYIVFANMSFSGTASKTYQLEIYKNGLTTGFATDRKLGTGGDVGSCSIIGIMQCSANDEIQLYQSTSDGGSAMTFTEASQTLYIILLVLGLK
jgi:hypothetical protein